MASALQTIIDGARNVVIKATGSGAVTGELIVDVSALVPACTRVNIYRVTYELESTMTASLLWDATSPVTALTLAPGNDSDVKFKSFGGLTNNGGAGVTGDILLTTVGTGAYSIIIEMYKHGTMDTINEQ